MYSVFCALAIIFVIFVVPETKGRDLDDIAKLFIRNKKCKTIDINEKPIEINEMDRLKSSDC